MFLVRSTEVIGNFNLIVSFSAFSISIIERVDLDRWQQETLNFGHIYIVSFFQCDPLAFYFVFTLFSRKKSYEILHLKKMFKWIGVNKMGLFNVHIWCEFCWSRSSCRLLIWYRYWIKFGYLVERKREQVKDKCRLVVSHYSAGLQLSVE